MKHLFAACLGLALTTGACASETVVLLHGLARTPSSLARMEWALQEAGYDTCNIRYPSTRHAIEVLARDFVLPQIRECMKGRSGPVSVVTHSLGGIIVRQIHQAEPGVAFGRVVMLGAPNHGSELADRMRQWPLYRWIGGPVGQQLGTGAESVPLKLGKAGFEVGIIAGSRPFFEPFAGWIPGPSDGKVSVRSTMLEGMSDQLVMPVSHAFMTADCRVMDHTITYLKTGRFSGRFSGAVSTPPVQHAIDSVKAAPGA